MGIRKIREMGQLRGEVDLGLVTHHDHPGSAINEDTLELMVYGCVLVEKERDKNWDWVPSDGRRGKALSVTKKESYLTGRVGALERDGTVDVVTDDQVLLDRATQEIQKWFEVEEVHVKVEENPVGVEAERLLSSSLIHVGFLPLLEALQHLKH